MTEPVATGIGMAISLGGPVLLILLGCAINNLARGYRAKWENYEDD